MLSEYSLICQSSSRILHYVTFHFIFQGGATIGWQDEFLHRNKWIKMFQFFSSITVWPKRLKRFWNHFHVVYIHNIVPLIIDMIVTCSSQSFLLSKEITRISVPYFSSPVIDRQDRGGVVLLDRGDTQFYLRQRKIRDLRWLYYEDNTINTITS